MGLENMYRILVSDQVAEEGLALLREHFSVDVRTDLTEDELVGIIPEYDALVVRSGTQVTGRIIEAGKRLKIIGRAGTGVDNIEVESATKMGIPVVNAPEG
ncbi:MAG: phosphoglycerate dehydrogenase, partial [Methanomicrobiales archaeon]|nr:phosphoglycerate dehydrogenase [Methanomicrobiales archaeon]